ncbi:MAG: RsmB/NOP family class I SAM-dependent RNA methyltransferase [Candidatus Gracilibacteria bacterium]|nr:RsmB/NOP family class I SAM-dependent RNA methyltransferase [bacterium]MDZ4216939.1 RsmB/NOP family class I SAM-dependent RNA methyltransferase [Candidatus Gracilibacteria bacterium]
MKKKHTPRKSGKRDEIGGLPADFVERLRIQFPEQSEHILTSFHQRPPVVRINTLLVSVKKFQQRLKQLKIESQPILLLPEALLVTNTDRKLLTDLEEYRNGWFYIQSIASQLAVKALDPQPGEKILDLCAAPGSKTTQIAIAMKRQGELMANDNNRTRLFRLISNLKHQKVDDFVEVKNYPGQNYPKFYPSTFDRILLDAPCSSESRFDPRYPKSIHFWSRHKVKGMAKTQKRLLAAAIQCLKQGGILVYSTCTFSPEENEMVIDSVLKKHQEMEIETMTWSPNTLPILQEWQGKRLHSGLKKAIRVFPDDQVEGFFICRLKRVY